MSLQQSPDSPVIFKIHFEASSPIPNVSLALVHSHFNVLGILTLWDLINYIDGETAIVCKYQMENSKKKWFILCKCHAILISMIQSHRLSLRPVQNSLFVECTHTT